MCMIILKTLFLLSSLLTQAASCPDLSGNYDLGHIPNSPWSHRMLWVRQVGCEKISQGDCVLATGGRWDCGLQQTVKLDGSVGCEQKEKNQYCDITNQNSRHSAEPDKIISRWADDKTKPNSYVDGHPGCVYTGFDLNKDQQGNFVQIKIVTCADGYVDKKSYLSKPCTFPNCPEYRR